MDHHVRSVAKCFANPFCFLRVRCIVEGRRSLGLHTQPAEPFHRRFYRVQLGLGMGDDPGVKPAVLEVVDTDSADVEFLDREMSWLVDAIESRSFDMSKEEKKNWFIADVYERFYQESEVVAQLTRR